MKAQTKNRKLLDLGCTQWRHEQIGIHAVVNARGSLQHLNNRSMEEIELIRDSRKVKDRLNQRIRFYQFTSQYFRRPKNRKRVEHLLSRYDD